MPRVTRYRPKHPVSVGRVRDYVDKLPYYMTLSICPLYLGSAVWSIFWEPGVQCNLASAWLGSIHQVIKPLLEAGSMERLAKVFALRRPRLAPLWLGIFLCGCTEVLDAIESHLTTLEDQPWMRPDPDIAAWTGSRQSFFDEAVSGSYIDPDDMVPRADILRHRFNYRLGDTADIVHFGWQPFGAVKKAEVEPELWPRLECIPQPRKYVHWVWWLSRDESVIEEGFRRNKDKPMENEDPPDYKANLLPIFNYEVRLEASRQATFRVFDWGSKTATGDRSIDAMAMPGLREHSWFAGAWELA